MSQRMSVAELREIGQPPAVMGRRNSEHWAGSLYLRRLSIYLTWLLLPTRITANGVTWLMIWTGVASSAVLLWTSWWAVLLCALGLQLQILLDCSDGELARARGTTSPVGVYLDRIGHYLTEATLPIALGFHVSGGLGSLGGWTTVGALTGTVVLLNKSFGDLIHVARGYARLPLLSEDASVAAVRVGLLRRLRSLLKLAPFYRAFVALEFSLICLVAASIDAIVGGHDVLRGWAIAMLPLAVLLSAGHLAAILLSRRLTD
ncbi:CDP-alcohol phosphatidyltransferase family protein [Jatrophihabitans sp.]|uniref:CDP-alcohol phosphatidyltransferase family protein n=1 Tax=Jatrophihabitans sp. TaxID=1932789 RepID=UPI0030C7741A|nr:CDP-alcohol phosphatidyltransferase family protein [Jatrophihabitans sp.]